MGVKMTPSAREIRAEIEREYKRFLQRLVASLQYCGEEIINSIRNGELSNWSDRSGNLRSSIGYIVTIDGQIAFESDFQLVLGAQEGSETGRAYARALASLHPSGIALIVVAGMNYASYVEAMETKQVLAGAEVQGRAIVEKMLAELNQRYANDTN